MEGFGDAITDGYMGLVLNHLPRGTIDVLVMWASPREKLADWAKY
jgi:hypothetical protein